MNGIKFTHEEYDKFIVTSLIHIRAHQLAFESLAINIESNGDKERSKYLSDLYNSQVSKQIASLTEDIFQQHSSFGIEDVLNDDKND